MTVSIHPQCKVEFLRKVNKDQSDEATSSENICFKKLVEEIRVGLARGDIYILPDVWQRYSHKLSTEFNVNTGSYKEYITSFKRKLEKSLPGEIEFVPQLDLNKPVMLFAARPAENFLQVLKRRSDELEDKKAKESFQPGLILLQKRILSCSYIMKF